VQFRVKFTDSFLEVLLLRTGALALLAIYLYKQVRKHWRQP